MKKILYAVFLTVYVTLWPSLALAYIDPSVASLALQFLGALLISSLFFIKTIYRKVTLIVRKFFNPEQKKD